MSCIFKIKEGFNSFTNTEKKLAKYILHNKELVINLSAQELASKADISPAAVVRFSKTIGYKGFTALKVELAKDREELNSDSSVIINENDSLKSIVKKVEVSNISSIGETVGLNNIDTIEKAINSIIGAKTVYLFGIGASGLVAMDLQYKLLRINKNVIYLTDYHTQLSSAAHMTEDDVAIGISYSGESREVLAPIKIAQEKGVKTIVITKFNKNSLSKLGDHVLYIPNEEKEIRVGAITSRIAALTLIDILYLGIARYDFGLTKEYIRKTKEIVKVLK